MKKYFQYHRRTPNAVFFGVLGAVFAVLGVLAFWALESGTAVGIVLIAFGVLLAVLPQAAIFARYGIRGGCVRCQKRGIPRKIPLGDVGAAVVCVYDEYRRWKGFRPAEVQGSGGQTFTVPAIVLLRAVKEDELDLCDTRTNTRLTHRGAVLADMLLDFSFLEELWKDEAFAGEVYVSEYIYAMYHPAFDELFGGSGRVHVYDRIPKAFKEAQKAAK